MIFFGGGGGVAPGALGALLLLLAVVFLVVLAVQGLRAGSTALWKALRERHGGRRGPGARPGDRGRA